MDRNTKWGQDRIAKVNLTHSIYQQNLQAQQDAAEAKHAVLSQKVEQSVLRARDHCANNQEIYRAKRENDERAAAQMHSRILNRQLYLQEMQEAHGNGPFLLK